MSFEIVSKSNSSVSESELNCLKKDPHFNIWLDRVTSNLQNSPFRRERVNISDITVTDIDKFGNNLGFGKFVVNTTPWVPGIVFHRSPSVSILFIIECDGIDFVLLTVQPRIPAGYRNFPELIAGMLDNHTGNCSIVAVNEIREETGIIVDANDLINLGDANAFQNSSLKDVICKPSNAKSNDFDWLDVDDTSKSHNGWFNSPGGSSETTLFYLYRKKMTRVQFDTLLHNINNTTHGLESEGESIRLIIVPRHSLLSVSPSIATGHALSLLTRYENQ